MYGKVWEQMYTGSLCLNGEDSWKAIVTFQQMIVLADKDGFVKGNPHYLSRTTMIPQDIIEKGLEILSAPDTESRSTKAEGKRIKEENGGWSIYNYMAYRNAVDEEAIKAYWREQKRKKKETF
jgi:hypothetical protein